MSTTLAALALVALSGPASPAWAQHGGDAATGATLARTWCSTCHVVGPGQADGTSTGAPPFAAIAHMKSTTPTALRVFLQTPHGRMPDLHLSRQEIADVSAYIMSLRKP